MALGLQRAHDRLLRRQQVASALTPLAGQINLPHKHDWSTGRFHYGVIKVLKLAPGISVLDMTPKRLRLRVATSCSSRAQQPERTLPTAGDRYSPHQKLRDLQRPCCH
jgi:hypothetical protein